MFEEAGIGAVPFKGPTLAAAAYGNPALRESGDLDILVRKWDLARAMELCLRRGFEQKFDYHESSAAERFFAYKHILVRGPLIVELHWALSHRWFPLRFDLAHARERLVQTPFVGTTISEFAPEDQLLLLCVHGARHEWNRLIWICDCGGSRQGPRVGLGGMLRAERPRGRPAHVPSRPVARAPASCEF